MAPPSAFFRCLALGFGLALAGCSPATPPEEPPGGPLVWEKLPPLPDPEGFAGMFAGVSGGALLAAGGANFPAGYPWQGGRKVWHDRVWVLDRPDGAWREAGRLPRPLGYGVSAVHREGVVCVGGSDNERHYADAFRLEWRGGRLETAPLPALPRPVANACGAILGDTLYLAGGIETPDATAALRTFFALDLAAPGSQWRELPPWPGPARMLSVAAAQDGGFYIVSGTDLSAGPDGKPVRRYLIDAYRFAPASGWRPIAGPPRAAVAAPSPAPSLGQSHFVVLSGDDGSKAGFEPMERHPGFPSDVLSYHTLTDTWTRVGDIPAPRVTVPVVRWRDRWALPSGEARPGVRSPDVWGARLQARRARFGWVNYASLLLYPAVMLSVAWWVGRQRTTEDFFRGGQRIPWWAAGLSIYATMLSSITFMAVPAKTYASDWSYLLAILSVPLLAPLIIAVYLPFFRQLDVTSAYEYLERRFNLAARWFGSASFIVFQLGRTAIVLYLPALALSTVSNFEMRGCILVMGVICILMTFEGGLKSAVWTDVAQTFILLAGALATLVVALACVPGGAAEVWRIARADDKLLGALRWTPELTMATGWVILIGNLFGTLIPYTSGQDVVQRYVSTSTARQAARSIWTNAIMVLPTSLLFFSVGTALYAFYKLHPGRLDPSLRADAVFPLFIVNELPAGLGGLVVAGIFAAAQPTSSLNSIATAWVADFQARLRPGMGDAARLRLARIVTLAAGVLGTGAALLMTLFDIASAWDAFMQLLGLAGSTLAGLFALGIFTRRASGAGAVAGIVAGVAAVGTAKAATDLNFFTYAPIGILAVVIVGYFASLVLPSRARDLAGLTVFTLKGR